MSSPRIGLGCMRLSTDAERDEARAQATIAAALETSVRIFDTARAYGHDASELGHNERLVARTIVDSGADPKSMRIITKCGMRRPESAWLPDGRAKSIAADVLESVAALGALPIDTLLLHAPDPRTPLGTSVRALAAARDAGLTRAIGLSNVTLRELEEARAITRIDAIEVALGAFDDEAARGGLIRYCSDHGIEIFAHSPFGGPKRKAQLRRDPLLQRLADSLGVTRAEIVLAYLLRVSTSIVPLVGARSPEAIRGAVYAADIELDAVTLALLDQRFPGLGRARNPLERPSETDGEVVLLMGIAGAGKSRLAERYVERGYVRLNRDSLGGTLRDVARALDARLASGERNFVLDNTYTTRASRNDVVAIAHRHRASVRCVFVDTPLADAQVNVVLRILGKYGELLAPEVMRVKARRDPNLVAPTVLFRMLRELEPPAPDEGFSAIETVDFERVARPSQDRSGAAIAFDRVVRETDGHLDLDANAVDLVRSLPADVHGLVFAWRPQADATWLERAGEVVRQLSDASGRRFDLGICSHPAGPPICWCRPPLPGLWLEYAEKRGIDARRSVVIAASDAHRAMARAVGLAVE